MHRCRIHHELETLVPDLAHVHVFRSEPGRAGRGDNSDIVCRVLVVVRHIER